MNRLESSMEQLAAVEAFFAQLENEGQRLRYVEESAA
jgi:hypothetical protein